MISTLASPSVCVIDDEEQDYRPILEALIQLDVGCVHVHGDPGSPLPPHPFRGLRLVFADLHLSNTVGKQAASHAANVFLKIVAAETAPVVVVIWSKFAADITVEPGVPPEDQETEAELFRRTLLEAEPKYRGRLLFIEMAKPKPADRPENWIEDLKAQIEETLSGQDAVNLLWTWESVVRTALQEVSQDLTALALTLDPAHENPEQALKVTMQLLAKAQGEAALSETTASRHLSTVLGQLLVDQLEHTNAQGDLSKHGAWLTVPRGEPTDVAALTTRMNAMLLTASAGESAAPLTPGMVCLGIHGEEFKRQFGIECLAFVGESFKEAKRGEGLTKAQWEEQARAVLIELSPVCDVAQGKRVSAIFVAGLVLPSSARPNVKSAPSIEALPVFDLRWAAEGFAAQTAFLVFCSRYKLTIPGAVVPGWLKAWFRLRELPTASLRNWHSGHAARIGYVSL